MTLPSSGSIAMSQVNAELSFSPTATISFNDSSVRTLTGTSPGTSLVLPTGFYGKSSSVTYTTLWYSEGGPSPSPEGLQPDTYLWEQWTSPSNSYYYAAALAKGIGPAAGGHQYWKGIDFAFELSADSSPYNGWYYIYNVNMIFVGNQPSTIFSSVSFPSPGGWGGGTFPSASTSRYYDSYYSTTSFSWSVPMAAYTGTYYLTQPSMKYQIATKSFVVA